MIVRSTIWLALLLFAAGEIGRRRVDARGVAPAWAWPVFTAGAVVCVLHVLAAYHWRYGWSHADVVRETARQTSAVYGLDWGGGVYVNVAFVCCWIADAMWWRVDPDRPRPRRAVALLRAFYFVIIFNAAIVFARGAGRLAGLALVAVLLWAWFAPPQKVLSHTGRVVP